MTLRLALIAGLALGPLSLPGQDAKPDALPAMAMPKPGPEMAKLAFMVGTWHVVDIHEPGFMGPGGKGHGTGTVSLGPGGLSLLIDYKAAAGPMKTYRGHGVTLWDGEAKVYKQVWVDNMAPMLMTSSGNWEGGTIVMNAEGMMMGKAFKSRDTISGMSKDGYTITTEMSLDGSPMNKVMTLVHTRVKASPAK